MTIPSGRWRGLRAPRRSGTRGRRGVRLRDRGPLRGGYGRRDQARWPALEVDAAWNHFGLPSLPRRLSGVIQPALPGTLVVARSARRHSLLRLAALEEDHGRDREDVEATCHLGLSSTFSFTNVTRSPCSSAMSARIGPTTRHGPHQGAQKSTTTGRSAWSDLPLEVGVCDFGKSCHEDHYTQGQRRPRMAAKRSAGTRQTASATILLAHLRPAHFAVREAIGTSSTRNPARSARYVVSTWKA